MWTIEISDFELEEEQKSEAMAVVDKRRVQMKVRRMVQSLNELIITQPNLVEENLKVWDDFYEQCNGDIYIS